MKPTIVVGLVMLGLGFAIGWVAKPVPAVKDAPVAASAGGARKAEPASGDSKKEDGPLPTKRAEREPLSKPSPGGLTAEQAEQSKKMQESMKKSMVDRIRGKFESRIEKLALALNLTPEQKSALLASLAEKMTKFETMNFNDPKSMEGMEEVMKGLTNKAMEDQLAPSLTAEQQEAMTAFKDRELRGTADNMALKNLSRMQGLIEFEEGQRDEVYKLLVQDAEASAKAEDENPDVSKLFTEGMGIEMDPYDLGLQKAMTDAAGINGAKLMSGSADERQDLATGLRETINARIDAKVEVLRPVLNEKQLEQYRGELKTKGLGMYGPVLDAMEKRGDH